MEEVLQLIPIKHDVFTYIFFLGSVQAFFLALIVGWKSQCSDRILILLCSFLVFIGALILDLFLVRSGHMRRMLWYNDITEWMVLGIGPLLYLISKSLISKKPILKKNILLHFSIPLFYLCYQLFYIFQPIEHKYNAYVGSFHKTLDFLSYEASIPSDPLLLKQYFERILLASILAYAIAGGILMVRSTKFPNWREVLVSDSKYTFILWSFGSLVFNGIVVTFLFLMMEESESHLFIGIMLTVEVSMLYLLFIGASNVFSSSWVADKYDTSGMKHRTAVDIFKQIEDLMDREKPYLMARYGLRDLAMTLDIPSNHVSQAINSSKAQNFNEYINMLRIQSAIELLEGGKSKTLTIEGIGKEVGFSSKSSFYAAFKKVTGSTPLIYDRELNAQ